LPNDELVPADISDVFVVRPSPGTPDLKESQGSSSSSSSPRPADKSSFDIGNLSSDDITFSRQDDATLAPWQPNDEEEEEVNQQKQTAVGRDALVGDTQRRAHFTQGIRLHGWCSLGVFTIGDY
jgi:hypothetical protein